MTEIAPRIVVDEKVRFGKPVVAGTRVPVDLILAKLAAGMSIEELGTEYGITLEDVRAVEAHDLRAAKEHPRTISDEEP